MPILYNWYKLLADMFIYYVLYVYHAEYFCSLVMLLIMCFCICLLLVPTPEINLNANDVYYIAGSSLVLCCQLVLLSENIDINTVAVFKLKNNFHDAVLISDMSAPGIINETKLIYTALFNISNLKLSAAGEYTCTGIIDDAVNSSFIIQSNETVYSENVFIKSK